MDPLLRQENCYTLVSRLIADLEEHVNFRLFDRRKKRLIPTLEAKLLYDEVEKAFNMGGNFESDISIERVEAKGDQI